RALPLPPQEARLNQRPFPPRGYSSSLPRYYGLLGLPLGTVAFRLPPYRSGYPLEGPPRRVSPVPLPAPSHIPSPIPRGSPARGFLEAGPPSSGFAVCCLRREMLGSASSALSGG